MKNQILTAWLICTAISVVLGFFLGEILGAFLSN